VAAQDLQRAAVGLPDAGGAVARGGDDALAGNRELGGVDGVGVAAQDLLGADVGAEDAKHAGGAVVASGDDPLAVGAERGDVDGAVVAAQDRGRRVGLCGAPDQVAELATPAAEGRAPGGQRAGHAGLRRTATTQPRLAPGGGSHNDSGALHPSDRAHRRARHAVLLSQRGFVERTAGWQLAGALILAAPRRALPRGSTRA